MTAESLTLSQPETDHRTPLGWLWIVCLIATVGIAWGFDQGHWTGPLLINHALAEGEGGFAVVELFTSAGCSSCPAADRQLAEIERQARRQGLDVYVLSQHVDYWNRLGWTDPFSRSGATARQWDYARRWGADRVYTPQLVINGTTECVGSDRRQAVAAINAALRTPDRISVTLQPADSTDGKIVISARVDRAAANDQLHIALVRKSARQQITAGENNGRDLVYTHIVQDWQTVLAGPDAQSVTFLYPAETDLTEFRCIGIVQAADGVIRGATEIELARP